MNGSGAGDVSFALASGDGSTGGQWRAAGQEGRADARSHERDCPASGHVLLCGRTRDSSLPRPRPSADEEEVGCGYERTCAGVSFTCTCVSLSAGGDLKSRGSLQGVEHGPGSGGLRNAVL